MFWQEKFYTVHCTVYNVHECWRKSQKNVLAREILYKSTGEKARTMFWQEKFYTRVLARKPEECTGKRKNTRVLARNPEECSGKRHSIQEYWRENQKNVLAREIS